MESSGKNLTPEEIEAFNMWLYKQNGIMPNQYHHFYQNGDTMIYPEHIADLTVIDKMWGQRLKRQQQKAESKHPKNNPLAGQTKPHIGGKGAGFYGRKYTYHK